MTPGFIAAADLEANTPITVGQSELAALRDQVRVLREACESARRLIPFGVTYQQLTDALAATEPKAQP